MTTKEAFKHLSDQRGWYKMAGITINQASSIKYEYNHGLITDEHISKLLANAGYKVQPAIWDVPDHIVDSDSMHK